MSGSKQPRSAIVVLARHSHPLVKKLSAATQGEFSAKLGQLNLSNRYRKRVITIGMGEKPSLGDYKTALCRAIRTAREMKFASADIEIPSGLAKQATDSILPPGIRKATPKCTNAELFVQWATAANYDYSAKSDHVSHSMDLKFKDTAPAIVNNGMIVGEAVHTARTLGNIRPDVCTPAYIAEQVKQFVMDESCSDDHPDVSVPYLLTPCEMQEYGLNLLQSVGQGSLESRQPRLLVAEYVGAPKMSTSTCLVGKGITMDTGGLNIKSYGSMESMHMDMMGAAAVYAAFRAAVQLRLKANVTCVLPLAENSIGSKAYMPSSILKSMKGSTVEVTNTDAEGRLVLADAITFIQRAKDNRGVKKSPRTAVFEPLLKKHPAVIVDVATLTGACPVALGNTRAGLFSNNMLVSAQLSASGAAVGEPVWPLPIAPEHREALRTETPADMKNCATGRNGGASTAAAFLEHFIEDGIRWAHLDIAGPGSADKAGPGKPSGAPGWGVQLLIDFIRRQQ